MYDYDYNLANNEQPLPFDSGAPPLQQPNHQHDQCGVACPAGGIWVYVCSRFIGSLVQMAPPPPLTGRPPHIVHTSCMANCCRSGDDQSSNHTASTLPVADDPPPKKLIKKYSMDDKPTLRVYCKSLEKYSLTICGGKVTLAPTNTSDPHQRWIKEEEFGKKVKDEKGHSSFALINKATGQAIKHSIGQKYPVQLIKYDPDKLDESVLWSRGVTREDGYRSIRAVYDICLNLDAHDCPKNLERTEIRQYSWNGGNNQLWGLAFF